MADARDFYATLAQVLPVLLLTVVWDRDWLTQLATRTRGSAPGQVRIWGKTLVRRYTLFLTTVQLASIAACLLVLAGAFADSVALRVLLVLAAAMALVTLLVRISAGVIKATDP